MIDGAVTTQQDTERELPKGWRWVRLGDVCDLLNGYAFDSISFSRTEGTPLIRIRDLKTNAPSEYFKGAFDTKYLVQPNSLLIGMDGEFRCYRWAGPPSLLNQRVCQLLPHEKQLDATFLLFSINQYLYQIEEQTPFTTVKHISSKQILDIKLALPALAEQNRIAVILTKQMEAVKEAQAAAEAQLAAGKELWAAYLQAAFESGEAQEWEKHPLGAICNISTGATPDTGVAAYYQGTVPFAKTAEITNNRISKTTTHISEQAIRDYGLKLYQPGTVLMAMYGQGKTRGQVAILDIAATTTQNAAAIMSGDSLNSEFLWLWLRGKYNYLRQLGFQGDLSHLSLKYVKELEIPLPSLDQQQRIATELTQRSTVVSQTITALESQLMSINQLPGVLLRRAFSGEL